MNNYRTLVCLLAALGACLVGCATTDSEESAAPRVEDQGSEPDLINLGRLVCLARCESAYKGCCEYYQVSCAASPRGYCYQQRERCTSTCL